ncbi:MAG TPA: serpin family protein, partial [Armatimonadota bacterium]|nr:serpin family protein [Armatimonadota bacterium]
MGRANALRTLVAIAVACAVAVLSCGCKPKTASPPPLPKLQPPPDPVDQAKVGALVDGHAAFGWAMLEEITGQAPEENVFISPTSIALALSMTLNGASGTTRDAMLAALQFEGLTADEINAAGAQLMVSLAEAEPAIALSIANSLWARDGISFVPEFIDINRTYYGARVSTLDFGAREAAKTINEWVAARTRDKIDRIVDDPIDPTAILFLINAIYFKGEWDE